MPQPRHPRGRSSALPVFSLLSVLAVLALACFPVLAQADNSGIQYETEVPTVPTHQSSNIPQGNDQNSSDGSNPKAHESNSSTGSTGEKDKSGTGDGAHNSQGNQAQGGNDDKAGSGSKGAGDVTNAKPVSAVEESPAESSDSGGSSPLVPILIAIVVLAAISIGVYYYRQRQGGSDTPSSPSAS